MSEKIIEGNVQTNEFRKEFLKRLTPEQKRSLELKYPDNVAEIFKEFLQWYLQNREDLNEIEKEKLLSVEFLIVDKYTEYYLKQHNPKKFVEFLLSLEEKLETEGLKYKFFWKNIIIKPKEVYLRYLDVNLYRAFNPYQRVDWDEEKFYRVFIWWEGIEFNANWDKAIITIDWVPGSAALRINFYLKYKVLSIDKQFPYIHRKEIKIHKFSTTIWFYIR